MAIAIPITINEIDYEVRIRNGRRSVWRLSTTVWRTGGDTVPMVLWAEEFSPSAIAAVIGAYEAQQQAQGKPYQSEVSE